MLITCLRDVLAGRSASRIHMIQRKEDHDGGKRCSTEGGNRSMRIRSVMTNNEGSMFFPSLVGILKGKSITRL